tara:strand:+ start:320 stop:547 length:228 start_codon:yes stop_codon:yes gene_type:complete
MRIIRRSLVSGETNVMDLPVTQMQLQEWQDGALIQNVFPDLTPDEREFIQTGITPNEWQQVEQDMGEVYDQENCS